MFIIYGWRSIPETIGEGRFFCPTCRRESTYDHQQLRTYVTLFFLPILPLAAGERCVRCRHCQMMFVEDVLNLPIAAELETEARYQAGDRVLGKRGDYWYPGTIRGTAARRIKVDFDDGKHDLLAKAKITPLDLQSGDPLFVRRAESNDYQFGYILTHDGDSLKVRFEDGRQEWTKLAQVRVIWEDEGTS